MSEDPNQPGQGGQTPQPPPVADKPKSKPQPPPVARKFAKQVENAQVAEPLVKVRVTKMGADKISTGLHLAGAGDELYAFGEIAEFPKSTAEQLEARGFVEIQGA